MGGSLRRAVLMGGGRVASRSQVRVRRVARMARVRRVARRKLALVGLTSVVRLILAPMLALVMMALVMAALMLALMALVTV